MLASPAPIPMHHIGPVKVPLEPVVKAPKSEKSVIDVQPKPETPSREASPAPEPPAGPLGELATIDQLFITKRLRVKNVLFLRGKKNKFFVRTANSETLYTVEEENAWWVGYLFYGLRPLQLKVTNSSGEEIMRVDRPFACTTRVLPCQLQCLNIFAPPGEKLGTVEQKWAILKPMYVVKNNADEVVFWIFGPFITLSCFNDVSFTITRADGSPVGSTRKRWQGVMHAMFYAPITDKFGISFDMDLSVSEKALLLAATLLMHYMYYDA